jgi:hypothetical protein
MDGFSRKVAELLVDVGIREVDIFQKRAVELPGFYRPTKEWDIVVVVEGCLLAAIELKSQIGPLLATTSTIAPKRRWVLHWIFGLRIARGPFKARLHPGWDISYFLRTVRNQRGL